jgi:hypothetical protein
MAALTLVDATDLASWANRLDAQSRLPQVVRRLVHATVARVLRIGFPAGEGVQAGGWDGVVRAERGNAFVPDGISVWEMGATRDVKGKADSDYEKRLKNPLDIDPAQSAFIFVTPRKWGSKTDWATARKGEGVWLDVRAYDAEDLAQWLETAPVVHLWLSVLLGKHPEDSTDLESFWQDWSETTRPAITPSLLLAGRTGAVELILKSLRGPPEPFAIRAESRDEALAVFAAALSQMADDERVPYMSRAVIAQTLGAWNRLSAPGESLILIPAFESSGAIARAARHGHRAVIPLGAGDPAPDSVIDVPPVSRHGVEKALVSMGITEDRARDLARVAHRSTMTFRRGVAVVADVQQPRWAAPSEARRLLPAMFAGTWDGSYDGDRQAVSELSRGPYPEFTELLVRWSSESDPPARRTGDAWYLVSKRDSWSLLSRYLAREDLDRFCSVATEILSTTDPLFDVPVEERWMARVRGHIPRHSPDLRKGLADSLAMLGAAQQPLPTLGLSPDEYAKRTVAELLKRANADWRIWATLSPVLPLLAEAAPDAFLAAAEHGTAGKDTVLRKLFGNGDPLFSSSPHTGLLWSLETLAWCPDYLGRCALLLTKLVEIDPGGKLANRPDASLLEIFLPWLPQTTATLEQRLAVLDTLRERAPAVAWNLMVKLLPDRGTASNHPTPHWRDWAPDSPPRVTNAEWFKAGREVAVRMIEDAAQDANRWRDIIKALPRLPLDLSEKVIRGVSELKLPNPARAVIADALRTLVSRHRSYPDAGWTLEKERVDRLEELYRLIEPTDVVIRVAWLFCNHPALLNGREQDWEAYQEAIEAARQDAVRSVYAERGAAGLIALANAAEDALQVGVAAGHAGLLEQEEDDTLRECLAAGDPTRSRFSRGFVGGRVAARGLPWAENKIVNAGNAWTPEQRAEFLTCLRPSARTWDLARSLGRETDDAYWFIMQAWVVDPSDIERAVDELLAHDRPYSAIDLLYSGTVRKADPPGDLVARALETAMTSEHPRDCPGGTFGYHVSELLDRVANSAAVDPTRIVRLEWGYIGLFDRSDRTPKLLHQELGRNPQFFADVLAFLFRGDNDEPREPTPAARSRAERAFALLESWRTVPGTSAAGIDAGILTAWVHDARRALAASGRAGIGDERIGHVLSGSPLGPDGAWPHPAVRDVIENVASDDLDRGITVGVHNGRGIVSKELFEGGAQERALAEKYDGSAAIVRDRWPRTAALLRRLADGYRAEAAREDERATREEEMGF